MRVSRHRPFRRQMIEFLSLRYFDGRIHDYAAFSLPMMSASKMLDARYICQPAHTPFLVTMPKSSCPKSDDLSPFATILLHVTAHIVITERLSRNMKVNMRRADAASRRAPAMPPACSRRSFLISAKRAQYCRRQKVLKIRRCRRLDVRRYVFARARH